MQEKGLDYASALELYYKNKNYIDTRMYGYDKQAASRQAVADVQAGARVDAAGVSAEPRDAATQATRAKDYLDAIAKHKTLQLINPKEANNLLQAINATYPEFAGQGGGASSVLPNAKIVNVTPSP